MTSSSNRLSPLQIGFMVVLFEVGSTPMFLLGGKARQDAWLALLIGSAAGFLLLLALLALQRLYPGRHLMQMLESGFGRLAGRIAGFVYCFYFAYEAMRNVRDLGELTKLTLLPNSPMAITMFIFVLTAAYAIAKGTEIVFRLPELLLPLVIISYALLILLLVATRCTDFARLAPVMENGLKPVLQAALPDTISFPFGQMLVFLMLWHLRGKPGSSAPETITGYIAVSLFLVFMNALNLAVLGPALATSRELPFLNSVRTLTALGFIERLDIMVTFLIFIGITMKMMLFYLCAVRGLAYLSGIRGSAWIFFFGFLIYASSFIERNYTQHIAIGLGPSLKIDMLFQLAIPLLLLFISLIRRSAKKKKKKNGLQRKKAPSTA
ncbi:GerAB/ArcD/ProY family transporter [Paenibacillus glufosinatiresistens]|uniref:GerAB/ArcD/ProY family transporter n=1 Tax=Paenibacillus glufosinatiresistens TaxID=3070657 RepID=UPI00286E16DC|nr:endospore germination permease [Paenibacillus sp. YX.27]